MHLKDHSEHPVGLEQWVTTGSTVPLDYSEQVQAMQSGETFSNRDYVLRNLLVLICCATLVYATGDLIYLIWGLGYGVVNTAYTVALRRMEPPFVRRKYFFVCALHILGNLVYGALPLLLWVLETDAALRAVAVFALAGAIMQHLTRKNLLLWTTVADGLTVALITGTIAMMLILSLETTGQRAVVAVGSTAVIVYYVHSLMDSTRAMLQQHNSRKEAIELQKSNAISQITAGIAHDFNNILTAVQGFVELSELEDNPRERAVLLQQARVSTRQAIDIVAKMTAYVERSQISPSRIDIDEYLDSPRAAFDVLAPEFVEVVVEAEESGLRVYVDRAHLDTALINLAQNAIEALAEQPGRLALRVAKTRGDQWPTTGLRKQQTYVVFRVTDTGGGIRSTDLKQVTEPFFTTKSKAGGSGLGLSMVKGFARQSGGALVLRNHDAGGLEANLILPSRATSGT